MKRISALVTLVLLFFGALTAAGQPHPRPAKGKDVKCEKCVTPNKDRLTVGYGDPLVYIGRYVDSANTRNVEDIGMRTVRAQKVRISEARERIFIEYGDAVVGFPIPMFLENITNPNLWPVGILRTGRRASRYGDPIEIIAKPNTFFYAEADASGWVTPKAQDVHDVLAGWDAGTDGNLYAGTLSWGWGVSRDENAYDDVRHMEFRSQVVSLVKPNVVISVKTGTVPCAIVSASGVVSPAKPSLVIYDTSDPRFPRLRTIRYGRSNSIVAWARFDATRRLAVVHSDGKLRVYTYSTFLRDAAPLGTFEPAKGNMFHDLSFDDKGGLWAVESGKGAAALWQLKPAGLSGYVKVSHDIRPSFAPTRVAVRKGYVVVGGNGGKGAELRLYRLTKGVLGFVDTGNFFYRYYHDKTPPSGYASASTYLPAYTSLSALNLLEWKGRLYLLYSADGLGDVYELKL